MFIKLNPESSSPMPTRPIAPEKIFEMEKTKVRSIIVNAFPFLSPNNAGLVKLLQQAENETLDLYGKEWKVVSEDQLLPWLEKSTLLNLVRKVSEVGSHLLISPKNLTTLKIIANEKTEYISWLLETLDGIAKSQEWESERLGEKLGERLGERLRLEEGLESEELENESEERTENPLLPKRTRESEEGVSVNGSYIVKTLSRNSVVPIAIMKPSDEETGAPNCPNTEWRDPSKRAFNGIMPGEGPMREHIAYLLGKELGVPYTMCSEGVVCSEFIGENKRKTVSLQRFVPKSMNFERQLLDSEKIERLQRVDRENIMQLALLDMRLFNVDRGAWNLMITDENQLVPIDHGAALSADMTKDSPNFCWRIWPQTHTPLSEGNKAYIRQMDWFRDKQIIQTLYPDFPLKSLETAQFGYELLKAGEKYRLTPYEMSLFYIGNPQKLPPSHLLLERMKESHDFEGHLPVIMDKFIGYYSRMRGVAQKEVEKLSAEFPQHKISLNALFFEHNSLSGMREPLISQLYRDSVNADFANLDSVAVTAAQIKEALLGFEKLMAAMPKGPMVETLRVYFLERPIGKVPNLLKLASESMSPEEIVGKVKEKIKDFRDLYTLIENEIETTPAYKANNEEIKNYIFEIDPLTHSPRIIDIIEKYTRENWQGLIKKQLKKIIK